MAKQGVELPPPEEYGVGMIFFAEGKYIPHRVRARDRTCGARRRPGRVGLAQRANRHRDADVAYRA
jgi:hypothetical protein